MAAWVLVLMHKCLLVPYWLHYPGTCMPVAVGRVPQEPRVHCKPPSEHALPLHCSGCPHPPPHPQVPTPASAAANTCPSSTSVLMSSSSMGWTAPSASQSTVRHTGQADKRVLWVGQGVCTPCCVCVRSAALCDTQVCRPSHCLDSRLLRQSLRGFVTLCMLSCAVLCCAADPWVMKEWSKVRASF